LEQVIFLIGGLGRGEEANAVATITLFDVSQFRGRELQCLIPGNLLKGALFAQERPGKPIGALYELMDIPALNA
jgi:hypothetical protein